MNNNYHPSQDFYKLTTLQRKIEKLSNHEIVENKLIIMATLKSAAIIERNQLLKVVCASFGFDLIPLEDNDSESRDINYIDV